MFTIEETSFEGYQKYKLLNLDTDEYISIVPYFGGRIQNIKLKAKSGLRSIVDYDKNVKELKNSKWYKNCLLVPFANRINNGRYVFDETEYKLDINFPQQNHSIHGLVYNVPFLVKETQINKNSVSITLLYVSSGKNPGYPFIYSVDITYTLSHKNLTFKVNFRNNDDKKIPLSVGYHPYFCLGKKVDDLMLELPVKRKIIADEKQIPTSKSIPFSKFNKLSKINSFQVDDCFIVKKNKDKKASTKIYDPSGDTEICIWQDTGNNLFNYLQIFIPSERKSIAIEPMTGNVDAFNNKKGLIVLEPNKEFSGRFGITMS